MAEEHFNPETRDWSYNYALPCKCTVIIPYHLLQSSVLHMCLSMARYAPPCIPGADVGEFAIRIFSERLVLRLNCPIHSNGIHILFRCVKENSLWIPQIPISPCSCHTLCTIYRIFVRDMYRGMVCRFVPQVWKQDISISLFPNINSQVV